MIKLNGNSMAMVVIELGFDDVMEVIDQIDNLYIVDEEELTWDANHFQYTFDGVISNIEDTLVKHHDGTYYIFSDDYVL